MLPLLAPVISVLTDITFIMTVGRTVQEQTITGYQDVVGTPLGSASPSPVSALGYRISSVVHLDGVNDSIQVVFANGGAGIATNCNVCKMYINGVLYPHDLLRFVNQFYYDTPGLPIDNPFGPEGSTPTIRLVFSP